MGKNNNSLTSMQMSKKLKEKLESLGKKNQSYEDIIWELIRKAKA